jgi:ethanolamine utilization protein EutM
MSQALGMVETRGFIAVVEAADAMLKTADVRFVGYERIGGAYCCATVRGELAAVKAAVEAGTTAARRVGEVVAARVIARPHPDLEEVLPFGPQSG